ncbi:MAG: hypothetical protein Q9219_005141 [cf. Caloplaca sp. 3 TL-2023]
MEIRIVPFFIGLAFTIASAAPPIIPATSNPYLAIATSFNYNDTETISNRPPTLLNGDYRLDYSVPSSPIYIRFYIHDARPIERRPLGETITRAQKFLRAHLSKTADSFLDPAAGDDPFEVDFLRTGKCMIGMQSKVVGGPGKERLTYRGALDVFQGLWEVLYMGRRERMCFFEVWNGTVVVGTGKVVVGNVFLSLGGVGSKGAI